QPARQQPGPRREPLEQRARQPRLEQDLAHQDEHRQRQQLLRGEDVPGVLREQRVERDVAEQREQQRAGRSERQPDPDAPGKRREQDREHRAGDRAHLFYRRRLDAVILERQAVQRLDETREELQREQHHPERDDRFRKPQRRVRGDRG